MAKPTELKPQSFMAKEPFSPTDATPFTLELTDGCGRKYVVEFTVRNDHLGEMEKAVKILRRCLRPVI